LWEAVKEDKAAHSVVRKTLLMAVAAVLVVTPKH
jgi:hypothetical protein